MTSSNGTTYTYDGLGQRVRKDSSGGAKEYFYFGGTLLSTRDAATGAWTDNIYGGGRFLATVAGTETATPVWRMGDHLDSLAYQADNQGNLLSTTSMTPFGQLLADGSGSSYLFTGLERDSENNTDHTPNRQYNSRQGRWLSPDPYLRSIDLTNPQSLNRYSYVLNNPLRFVDPSGLECVWDDGSYDAKNDPATGNVGKCQAQGGTWIELGQQGNWRQSGDSQLSNIVAQLEQGAINVVGAMGLDGTAYITIFGKPIDGQTMVNATIMQGQETFYGYYNNTPSTAGIYSTVSDFNGQYASDVYSWLSTNHALDPTDDNERIQMLVNDISNNTQNTGCLIANTILSGSNAIDQFNNYSPIPAPNPGRVALNWFAATRVCTNN
jgi:RHS repeat-associated protein